MSGTIVVTGATGHVGGRIADRLLAGDHDVRVVSRDEERLRPLAERGADPRAGSVEDAAFLEALFDGADAAFVMIPPVLEDYAAFQRRVSEAYATALAGSDVTHVVNLSSVGAHLREGTGPIVGLRENERRLDAVDGLDVLHLRPTFFMENYVEDMGTPELLREQGIVGSPLRPDLSLAQIATRDIGDVAAERLAARDFSGSATRELLGPRDYTLEETARILGRSVGKEDVPYVQFGYDDTRSSMLEMGMPEEAVDLYLEMYRAFNEGHVEPQEDRSEANTTPTTLESWAEEVFAPAYRRAG